MDGSPWTMSNVISLGVSFGLSGFCYCLYKAYLIKTDQLKKAQHVAIDEQLKHQLKETPGRCLQYAVIEGAVQPLSETFTSNFNEHVGVLHKNILTEHKQVWSHFSRTWTDCERVVHKTVNAIPFVLVGADETRVEVLQPLEASGVYTEMTHHKFHQGSYNFSELIGQILSGEKISGYLEEEEMLKVGTTLTGVGKLVLETDGSLTFGPPDNELNNYILTVDDFESVLSLHESMAACFKTFALAFAFAGAAVLLWVSWKYYKQVQRQKNTNRVEEADVVTENLCVICFTNRRDCVLLDCGHMCCCFICFEALPRNLCPICRQTIRRVVFLHSV